MNSLDKLKGTLLRCVDAVNIHLNPFEEFTRPADILDKKPLSEKAEGFWKDIQDNWLKGPNKEFYWSMKPNDLGDMAIWQGLYSFTCAVKGDIPALTSSLAGQRLIQTLGGDNRLARGADPVGGEAGRDPTRKYYSDKGYEYMQQVSESTLIGHMFGLWATLYFSKEKILQTVAARLLEDLAKQVVTDGYILKDQDGTSAKFGDLRPKPFTAPIRVASLACLLLLSYKASGNVDHKKLYDNIVSNWLNTIVHPETHFLWVHPQYQDILAYFILAMLCTSEDDPKRKRMYRDSLLRQWDKNKEEGNSFYTYIVAFVDASAMKPRHVEKAKMVLEEFNTDPLLGHSNKFPGPAADNSKIPSRVWGWRWARGGKRVALQPVPTWRRSGEDISWQRNPYSLGGSDDRTYNGLDFLSAYYLGKYLALF